MEKKLKELLEESARLAAESNKISDNIDAEFKIEKRIKVYHTIKGGDLPIYKKWILNDLEYQYRLSIINGRLVCHCIKVSGVDVELSLHSNDFIFCDTNKESSRDEWHDAVCKLLKVLD